MRARTLNLIEMVKTEELKSFLERPNNDWPTLDDLIERFPGTGHSDLYTVLKKLHAYAEEKKLQKLKDRSFRALNMRKEDRVILFAIKEGIRHNGSLALRAKSQGICIHKKPKNIIERLKKLSIEDKEIRKILEEAGFLK